jgi:hypothetical protein
LPGTIAPTMPSRRLWLVHRGSCSASTGN